VVVSQVIDAHLGPFRCVDLTSGSIATHHTELVCRFYLFVINCVEKLIFVNRPFPLDIPLPIMIFRLPFVRCLDLCTWRFSNTTEHLVY
jgi:hypothetical protein